MTELLDRIIAELPPPTTTSSQDELNSPPDLEPRTTQQWTGRFLSETDPAFWARAMKLDLTHHPLCSRLASWVGYFVRRSLRNDRSGGTWLLLEGPPGTGKTHAGRFAARVFNDWVLDAMLAGQAKWNGARKPAAAVINWSRYCIAAERDGGASWRLDEALENDVIVLDDVGAEADRFKSGATKAQLRDFLESASAKWLLISTNILPADHVDTFGARVADRLTAAKRCSTVGIPSYRPKLAMERTAA